MTGTVQVLKSRLPAPVRAVTRHMLPAMFDDVSLTDALGLPDNAIICHEPTKAK